MPFYDSRLIAVLFAGLMAVPAVALAQTSEPQTPPAAQEQSEEQTEEQTEAAKPSDEQLESFAVATISIVKIQEAAQKQMQAAVEDAGLTIEEYNQIARAAQADPEIDQSLQQLIQDRLGG